MTDAPFVSIIVLSYNSKKFLSLFDECIGSLLKTDYPFFELLIVDNGSKDNSADLVYEKYKYHPKLRLIKFPTNLGYAGGNNKAIEAISERAELIAFINSDVVVSSGWLRPLVEAMKGSKRVGVSGPAGTFVTTGVMPIPLNAKPRTPYFASHVLGHCILVRRWLFELVHGFNPNYFSYFEEADLCNRIRALGYGSLILPSVNKEVIHKPSTSFVANRLTTKRTFWLSRNMFYVAYENYPISRFLLAVGLIFLNRGKRAISLAVRSQDIANLAAVVRGTIIGFFRVKDADKNGYPRYPFKDPTMLPMIVDLLYITMPSRFVNRAAESIVQRFVRFRTN